MAYNFPFKTATATRDLLVIIDSTTRHESAMQS